MKIFVHWNLHEIMDVGESNKLINWGDVTWSSLWMLADPIKLLIDEISLEVVCVLWHLWTVPRQIWFSHLIILWPLHLRDITLCSVCFMIIMDSSQANFVLANFEVNRLESQGPIPPMLVQYSNFGQPTQSFIKSCRNIIKNRSNITVVDCDTWQFGWILKFEASLTYLNRFYSQLGLV